VAKRAARAMKRRTQGQGCFWRHWRERTCNGHGNGFGPTKGLDIDQTAERLRTVWPAIRKQLLQGTYRPMPVRRVTIPKPGGGERELGIPAVTDRLIQQALLQVLQPILDPTFSEHSYGFRPGRSAHDAVVYVRSRKAGARVMALLRRLYGKLRLTVNEAKSAVASVFGRKFLGYAFWAGPGGAVKRKVAAKPMVTFKQRIRQLTRRPGGRSLRDVVDRLRSYVLGWKAYYRLAQTPGVWKDLDMWMRHRLRAIQLKQWKRGKTMYRELLALGATPEVARRVAANSRRWWRTAGCSSTPC
jgi:Group II intron, maturase-specific domain/Reverse transcriptase (RNA-dependent DNA polymerase)